MLISWGKNTAEEETSKAQVLRQEHSCGASLMVRGENGNAVRDTEGLRGVRLLL